MNNDSDDWASPAAVASEKRRVLFCSLFYSVNISKSLKLFMIQKLMSRGLTSTAFHVASLRRLDGCANLNECVLIPEVNKSFVSGIRSNIN